MSTILCHIAFWDQRALFLLKQWQRKGAVDTLRLDPESIDSINNAVNAIVLEVAGSEATTLVLKSAAAVDAFIAGVSEELAQKIREAGFERYLRRSLHRREHIQKIRELLGVRNV